MDPVETLDTTTFSPLGYYPADTSYNWPISVDTVSPDIVTQAAAVPDTASNDQWTSFFQKTIGSVVGSALSQSNLKTQAQVQRDTQLQMGGRHPATQTDQQVVATKKANTLFVLGGAALVAMLVLKKV